MVLGARGQTPGYLSFTAMLMELAAEYMALENRLNELGIGMNPHDLFEHLFGENSCFAQTVVRALGLDYHQLCKFLATFYRGAQFGVPTKHLEEDDEFLFDGYMGHEAVNETWKKIGVNGKTGSHEFFWKELQQELNKDCRELFLTGEGCVP